jgi:hypothetical protein
MAKQLTRIGVLLLALFFVATAAQAQDDVKYGGSMDAREHGYQHGYRDGLRTGTGGP